MSKKLLFKLLAVLVLTSLVLTACGGSATEEPAAPAAGAKTYADMVLCYPQLGAESDWRTANTASL